MCASTNPGTTVRPSRSRNSVVPAAFSRISVSEPTAWISPSRIRTASLVSSPRPRATSTRPPTSAIGSASLTPREVLLHRLALRGLADLLHREYREDLRARAADEARLQQSFIDLVRALSVHDDEERVRRAVDPEVVDREAGLHETLDRGSDRVPVLLAAEPAALGVVRVDEHVLHGRSPPMAATGAGLLDRPFVSRALGSRTARLVHHPH